MDLAAILARLQRELRPGTVTMLQLLHDAECPAARSQRATDCRCDPDIRIVPIKAEPSRG